MQFPLHAARRTNAHDIPHPEKIEETAGLFDLNYNEATFMGFNFKLPLDQMQLAEQFAAALNMAYDQGRADVRQRLREQLGLSD